MKTTTITNAEQNLIKVIIEGEVDATSSLALDTTIKKALKTPSIHGVIVDCQVLEYISSAGLGVFIANHQDCRDENLHIIPFGLNQQVASTFELVGLNELFTITDTEEEAIKSLLSK